MTLPQNPSGDTRAELVAIEYISPHDIRFESEGFFTLVECGTNLSDDGILSHHAINVQQITQRSVAYLMRLLGLTKEEQVMHMLLDQRIGIEKRSDGRDRISSDSSVNPWMKTYINFKESSPE